MADRILSFWRIGRDSSSLNGRRRLLASSFLVVLGVGCALPGQLYEVAPAISGRLENRPAEQAMVLRLSVQHRESAQLFSRQEIRLAGAPGDAGERFSFDETRLKVAGHEFSKVYRAYLHLRSGEADAQRTSSRVVWRAEFSRRDLDRPIELACDLERPVRLGQVCRVQDPLAQKWLVRSGQKTFERLCSRCHGKDADLNQVTAPAGAPDLRGIAARRGGVFDRDVIAEWIEGRDAPTPHLDRTMPVWGEVLSRRFEVYAEGDELVGATLDPLLAYLESIQESVGR